MSDLKKQIELSVDASGVETGVNRAKRSLADLGATGATAGKNAAGGLDKIGAGGDQAAQKVDAATRNMIGSIQRQIATMQAGSKSSSDYYKALAGQRGIDVNALQPYLDQLDATVAKQAKAGISAAQMSAALRSVPAQFTDIATSLASGQAPLTVFLQQGGQLKDMFGGIGPAARALGGYVASLINPFTIAGGAALALAVAYKKGSEEADVYAEALILSGNAAGTTVSDLGEMAKRIDGIVGTQAAAAEALAKFAANGNISADSLERFTTVALKMERDAGQAVDETIKQFAELGKSPVEAATKLNEATHFLTIGLYQQIKALEDQGKTSDAAALAQKAYADAMESRMSQLEGRLGTVERAWRGITGAAKEAWDAMLDVGREKTNAEQLSSISAQIEASRARIARLNESGGGLLVNALLSYEKDRLAGLLQEQSITQENIRLQAKSAAFQKETADKVQARIQFEKDGEKFLSERVKMEREIAKAREDGAAAGATQAEIERRVADIRASHKGLVSNGLQVDKAKLGLDIDAIKNANEQLIGSYQNAGTILEAMHAARLISDRQYYESKRGFIELEARAQEDALRKELDRYRQERLTGKDKLENDKKIAEAEAKLATLRASTSAKLEVNSIQETAANKKIAQSYEDARQAAQAYLDTVARQNAAEIAGVGRGEEIRANQAGRNKIEDKFTSRRQELERDKRNGMIDQEQFDTYLQIAQDTYSKELQAYEQRTKAIKEKQGDWLNGANEALANYRSNAENVAGQSSAAFTSAFNGMTDGFASSVSRALVYGQSLEDGLKNVALNVADTFIASFIKIQIQKLLIDKTAAAGYAATIAAQAQAMSAMAGLNAFASTAAIPIVGPELAPAAAAAAMAIAEGFASAATAAATLSVASARNGFDIPAGVNPLTQLHEREMVLPAKQADVIRDMARNGGQSGGSSPITIVNQTSAKIGRVTERRLDNGERALILEEAVDLVAAQLADPNSKTSRAMNRNFSIQRSR
ncbi:phage tail length tape measure family protein [Noviherbaspirillum autotrophicum]|uniref:Bacteriophage tail tape measure N-terminal domain-containing protein n=1 Tax=Noviherbaspirillum autotrophicum TaxID=709839 RepID=A0A0C2BRX0_9BURK|nr:phage tail length tape measure family protein [Noviherbaspirillum autotrophicum]KIF80774.1 hypothetical protein TSA66_07985 [Noviherbaspirillum autotrophicum]KIF80811.1 hypothetical protein TSA66_08230 [Noviherbaspirillum autotrophicum]KIF84036.1 hypothetical protein TSA66_00920 [Noviherbaspirillum autotrophicum]